MLSRVKCVGVTVNVQTMVERPYLCETEIERWKGNTRETENAAVLGSGHKIY